LLKRYVTTQKRNVGKGYFKNNNKIQLFFQRFNFNIFINDRGGLFNAVTLKLTAFFTHPRPVMFTPEGRNPGVVIRCDDDFVTLER
jgi:hypothetical protein